MGKSSNTVPETSQEQELARVGAEQWDRGKEMRPLRDFVIKSVFQGGDEQRAADNNVAAGTRQAFSSTRPKAEVAMAKAGARPGSGAFNLGEAGMVTDEAETLAAARGGTRMAVDNQRLANLENIVKMGVGEQAKDIAGLTEVTRNVNEQAAQAAMLSAKERASRAALVGTLAGAAGRYYSNGVDAPSGGYRGLSADNPAGAGTPGIGEGVVGGFGLGDYQYDAQGNLTGLRG